MDFQYPSKKKLAHLPTPVHKLERLSKNLGGPDIYIKRDDLTGFGIGGNKVRKLEFSVSEALDQNADVLITCGGIQSNHARATAVVAAQLGIRSHLVLRGEPSNVADGNLLIDQIVGADFTFITPEEYTNQIDDILSIVAEKLKKTGAHPYIIPEGASNAIGAMGYLNAGKEIIKDEEHHNVKFDYIVCAVGSGGTYAGLLLAQKLHGLNADIIGVNVCDDEEYFVRRITGILDDVYNKFNIPDLLCAEDIHIVDGYVGLGYALSRPEEIELLKIVAKAEGIILDPVYTGKAMYGLVDQINKGKFKKSDKILFLHSGGVFGIFPVKEMFA